MQAVATIYKAEAYFKAGQFSDAVALLKSVPFRELPADHQDILVSSLMALTRYSDVVELLDDVPADELSPDVRKSLSRALFGLQQYNHAVALIERFPFDQSLETRKLLIESFYGLNQYSNLVLLIESDLAGDYPEALPADIQKLYLRSLLQLGYFQKVVNALEAVPVEHSLDLGAIMAASLFKLGRYLDAVKVIERLFRANPLLKNSFDSIMPATPITATESWARKNLDRLEGKPSELQNILLWSLFRLGWYERVIALIEWFPFDNPRETRDQLAEWLHGTSPCSELISPIGRDVVHEFLGRLPSDTQCLYLRSLFNLGHFDGVLSALKTASTEESMGRSAVMAASLFKLERYQNVVTLIERILHDNPSLGKDFEPKFPAKPLTAAENLNLLDEGCVQGVPGELRSIYVWSLFKLRRYERAIAFFELDPINQPNETRKLFVEWLFGLSQVAELVALVEHDIVHAFPDGLPADIQRLYLRSLFRLGLYQKVVSALEIVAFEKFIDLTAVMAASLFRLGRYLDAVNLIEKFFRENPSLEDSIESISPAKPQTAAERWGLLEHDQLEGVPGELRTVLVFSLFKLGRFAHVLTLLSQAQWSGMTASTRNMYLACLTGLLGDHDFLLFAKNVPADDIPDESQSMLIEGYGRLHMFSEVAALLERSPNLELNPATTAVVAESMYALQRFSKAAALFDSLPLEKLSEGQRAIYADALFHVERFDDIVAVTNGSKSVR